MKILLDTHFVLWVVVGSSRLQEHSWLESYRPWGVSPVSLLEIQYLGEAGRLNVRNPELSEAIGRDPRFVVDEPPLLKMIRAALPLEWTRDPFDRLLCAHSEVRRTPLATTDRRNRAHHRLLPRELRSG